MLDDGIGVRQQRMLNYLVLLRNSKISKIPMPASMDKTKNTAFGLAVPKDTRAGPGQKPAMPQPIPNKPLPITSRRSISRLIGMSKRCPRNDTLRRLMMAKEIRPTVIAPPITKANDGSQLPVRSRNPSTLPGLAMPETISPIPKSRPANKEINIVIIFSEFKDMAYQEYGEESSRHESDRRYERTW